VIDLVEVLAGLDVVVDTEPVSMDQAAFDPARVYRYALTRVWDESGDLLPWVMLNPSEADAFRADPTVTRCVGFSRAWGYGALGVLNAYALKSTNPKALRGPTEPIGPLNDDVIRRLLATLQGAGRPVLCAWGAHADQGRAAYLTNLIREAGHVPMCLGRTKVGAPRHPLYLASKTPMEALS
jgi:hypothetical protein